MIGQQQLVEIAKAVAQNARILIMDEPTSALSAPEVEILFRVIARSEVEGRGDRLYLAPAGGAHPDRRLHHRAPGRPRDRGQARWRMSMSHWIVRQMIGSDAKDFSAPSDHAIRRRDVPRRGDLPAAGHRRLCGRSRSVLSVRGGEILGVYGLMGAGRTEFLECVMGRHPLASGRIFIEGRACAGERRRRPDRARPCAHPRRPAARRTRRDPLGRRKSDDGEPAQAHALLSYLGSRAEAEIVGTRSQGPVDQGRRPRACRSRRSPAETSRKS